MPRLNTRGIVEKADLAVQNLIDDGGYLNPIQANQFIRKLIDQPTILNEIRVVPMNAPTMEINKIGFASRILRVAPRSGTALTEAQRAAPVTSQLTLETKEVIAEVRIPYDVLEDNIERSGLEGTIMNMISEHASLDLEELMILGDKAAGADAYLKLQDGIIKLAADHVVEFDTPPASIDYNIFKYGIQMLPTKYLRLRSNMRFYVSHYVESEYAASMAARLTVLGDTRLENDYSNGLRAFGVPVVPCALMPDDVYIFTDPKNMLLGVQRRIQVETDKDITARVYIIVLTLRIATQIEESDALVKATGVTDSPIVIPPTP